MTQLTSFVFAAGNNKAEGFVALVAVRPAAGTNIYDESSEGIGGGGGAKRKGFSVDVNFIIFGWKIVLEL